MSIMNQARERAIELGTTEADNEARRTVKRGANLETKTNDMPWMKGFPKARYVGNVVDRYITSTPVPGCNGVMDHETSMRHLYVLEVDDVTLGVHFVYMDTTDYYVKIPCATEGCFEPAWVQFSQYNSIGTLVDIVGKAINQNRTCFVCQAHAVDPNVCPTCGK